MKTIKSSTSGRSTSTFLWVAAILTIAALAIHAYLTIQHFDLKFGSVGGKSICDINDTFSCTAVAASSYAEIYHVPVALLGFAANLVLLLLIAWMPFVESTRRPVARRNILLVSGLIALASITMGSISMFMLSRYCLFCMSEYALSFLTFGALWLALPKPAPAEDRAFSIGDLSPVLILGAIAFAGAFIANDQIAAAYGAQDLSALVKNSINDWTADSVHTINLVDPLVEGATPQQSKMTIVEFADFRCIHCKHAAPVMKAFIQSHPDARLEFEPWPLDGECNTTIPSPNGASCMLARAVWCAQKNSSRGWDAHGYIYGQDETPPDVTAVEAMLPKIADASGVKSETLVACVGSEEAKETIRKQAAVGSALELQGTPTIYVNGKKLPLGNVMPVLQEAYSRIHAQ